MKATPEQLAERFKIEELQERLEFTMRPGTDDWYDGQSTVTVTTSEGSYTYTQYRDW